MSGLKELRNRIGSVRATRKITQAMQMVAASKLRRAQEAAQNARPYADHMRRLTARLASEQDRVRRGGLTDRLLDGDPNAPTLLIVASGQRGLCGGFNSQIVRAARRHAETLREEGRDISILCVGRKGSDLLRRDWGDKILDVVTAGRDATQMGETAHAIAARIIALADEGACGACHFFYSVFESVLTQKPTMLSLMPFAPLEKEEGEKESSASHGVYEYEPFAEEILENLARRNLSAQILLGLLESAAGEEGARMTAMDNATRNADEMIDSLSLLYNRTRQAIITKELVEIISGAEAL